MADVWFHRYEDGRDIEGRFDYNSWQESETGRKLAASLDKDVVLAEGKPTHRNQCKVRHPPTNIVLGYKEYKTERKYMARMGDWRDNKDIEIPLDGIGGVNILVKADVHRSGKPPIPHLSSEPCRILIHPNNRHQLPLLCL